MRMKSCIIAMIELFKVCPKKINILSDDVSHHRTLSCNPTSRKLKSYNHCCALGLLMYFKKSYSLLPFIFHKGSYDCKHKNCILTCKYQKSRYFQHIS